MSAKKQPPQNETAKNTAPGGAHTHAARYQVRLPGFLIEEEVGLGDAIKKATSSAGIRPCGGCLERAATLNRWVKFTRR